MTVEVNGTNGKPVEVVSFQWLLKYALGALAAIFLGGILLAWNVSAQVADVRHTQTNVQSDNARLEVMLQQLSTEVREMHRSQDSLLTILRYERERR